MKIFVLGGAGKMGCISVQDLANDERVDEIILADVNLDQARVVSEYLDSSKIQVQEVDIKDESTFLNKL
jgi:saccharopine dehydrogenase-like NADP-dependent oxidoreductase